MNLENLVVLVLVAAVCGFVADRMTQGRLPYGLVGAIFGALVGSWLLVEMFKWKIPGDMTAGGIPVLTAILGAAAIIFIMSVVSRSTTLRRTPLSRKRS
ncbi:MAG TPA: GlsB/YeaQ/YmgE family stress response membrane protein [Candidatus Dormibacteraeota bacterium]